MVQKNNGCTLALMKQKREDRLRYEASCAALLQKIVEYKKWPMKGTSFTNTKKLEWLLINVIPDQTQRENKIRLLFMGKFADGDDVYLRMIAEGQRSAAKFAAQVTEKYMGEVKEIQKRNEIRKTRVKQ